MTKRAIMRLGVAFRRGIGNGRGRMIRIALILSIVVSFGVAMAEISTIKKRSATPETKKRSVTSESNDSASEPKQQVEGQDHDDQNSDSSDEQVPEDEDDQGDDDQFE